jgi:hypothetical protein
MFCFKHPQILADKRCAKCSKWCCYLCSEVINSKDYCSTCAKGVNLFSFSNESETSSDKKIKKSPDVQFQVSASLAGQGMRVPWNSSQAVKKKICCVLHPKIEAEKQCSKCGKMFCLKCLRVNDASASICYKCWFDMPVSSDDIDEDELEEACRGRLRDFEPPKELMELIDDEEGKHISEKEFSARRQKVKKNKEPEYEYEFEEDDLEDKEHMFRIKSGFRGKRAPKRLKRPDKWLSNLNLKEEEESSPPSEEAIFSNLNLAEEEESPPSEEAIFSNLNLAEEEEPPPSEEAIFSNLNLAEEGESPPSEEAIFSNLNLAEEEEPPPPEEAIFSNLNLAEEEPAGRAGLDEGPEEKQLYNGKKDIDKEFENLFKAIESSPEDYIKEFSSNVDSKEEFFSRKESDSSYEDFFQKIADNVYEKETPSATPYEKFMKKKGSSKKHDIRDESLEIKPGETLFSGREKELVSLLENNDVPKEKKKNLICELALFEGEAVTEYIAALAGREEVPVNLKVKAIEALLDRKDKKALPFLLNGIKNERNSELRKLIAQAYSKIRYGK